MPGRGRYWRWGGYAVGAVGLIASAIGLMDFAEKRRLEARDAQLLIESDVLVLISPSGPIAPAATIADRISVGAGEFQFPEGAMWIANEVVMAPETVLRGRAIAIVAKSIRGGRIDASGSAGVQPGQGGDVAGRIVVAAQTLEGVGLIARGGPGAAGKPGQRGPDGRSGKCKGFGGYRMARVGEDGGNGTPGGPGGGGGVVVVRFSQRSGVAIETDGGGGGLGGTRGQGGRGGAGCMGAGGTQATKANGRDGNDGEHGAPARATMADVHKVEYQALIDTVRPNLGSPSVIISLIREL